MWDLIVSVLDHCLSFYSAIALKCGRGGEIKIHLKACKTSHMHLNPLTSLKMDFHILLSRPRD